MRSVRKLGGAARQANARLGSILSAQNDDWSGSVNINKRGVRGIFFNLNDTHIQSHLHNHSHLHIFLSGDTGRTSLLIPG